MTDTALSSSQPACAATIQRLYDNMGSSYTILTPVLCDSISTIEFLETSDEDKLHLDKEILALWLQLIRLQSFVIILQLDVESALRANFRTNFNVERRCNLKYVNVFIAEGYKYLFGYKEDKVNGAIEKIKIISEQLNDTELSSRIADFEKSVNFFASKYIDRSSRNLSIHYDQNPIRVYDNLESIEENIEVDRVAAFLTLIEQLSLIIKQYSEKYNIGIVTSENNSCLKIFESLNIFPDNENRLFNELEESLESYSQKLINIVNTCRIPEAAAKYFNIDVDQFKDQFSPLVMNVSLGIHLYFIYLDLASAIRGYLSSEFYFEKQINLRRIKIIVYEGFKHIYGFTEIDHSKSFWNQEIRKILANTKNAETVHRLKQIEEELAAIAANADINDVESRERSVHYRYKDRDNIVGLFHDLLESNPIKEMTKALVLLKIMPELIKLNTESLGVVGSAVSETIKATNNQTIEKMDHCMSMIENRGATAEQKQSMKELFDKIKDMITV